MKEGLCIYHADCNDGFASALAVWKKYGDSWDYQPMQYGDSVPDLADRNTHVFPWMYKNIMLVDFSLPRKFMEELSRLTNLLVIDHHKTAMKDCDGLGFCKFDLTQSGCELTWEYLFPEEEMPYMFELIGYRDIGKSFDKDNKDCKLYLPSKMLHCGLQLYPKDFVEWSLLLDFGNNFREAMSRGERIFQLQEKVKDDFVKRWEANPRFAHIETFSVPIVNHTDANTASEFIGALSEGYNFAVGYFETCDKRVFSLRTRRKDIDCGAIAKIFGGGGHPGAAGFAVDLKRVEPEMSKEFFQSISIV